MPNVYELPTDVLVNKEHLIEPIDYKPQDLVEMDDNEGNFHGYDDENQKPTISGSIKPKFEEMKAAFDAHFENIDSKMIVDSGFRSYEYQKRIYMQKAREISEEILGICRPKTEKPSDTITKIGELIFDIAFSLWGKSLDDELVATEFRKKIKAVGTFISQIKDPQKASMSDEEIASEIFEKTRKRAALPGTSEHQTGLAFDVAFIKNGRYTDDVEESDPEIEWLMENSWQYGFILRYPKGKENVTEYGFECWHYRYVGRDIAEVMYNEGLTLEEYYTQYKPAKKR